MIREEGDFSQPNKWLVTMQPSLFGYLQGNGNISWVLMSLIPDQHKVNTIIHGKYEEGNDFTFLSLLIEAGPEITPPMVKFLEQSTKERKKIKEEKIKSE